MLDTFLNWLSNNPLAIIIGLAILGMIVLIALLQGREITVGTIKIGPRPNALTQAHKDGKYQKVITLAPNESGLAYIWPQRKFWEPDPVNGLEAWKKLVCEAKEVDIVSNTLWTRWMHEDDFRKKFFSRIGNEHDPLRARIVIYHPGAAILKLRAAQEKPGLDHQMIDEINSTLQVLAQERKRLSSGQANLEVRLNLFFYQLTQIIRADDQMLVATYLTRRSGTPSPTFQIHGYDTDFYKTYQEQFKALWEPDPHTSNLLLGNAEWDQILNTGTLSLSASDDPILHLLYPTK